MYLHCKLNILFTGDESGRGSILTPEGRKTLFKAKSSLDALVRVISDASVMFRILTLLQKYKQGFLELLKAMPIDEATKKDTERSLSERNEEIEEFKAEKVKVQSFISMCGVIKPGEILKGKHFHYRKHVHSRNVTLKTCRSSVPPIMK